MYTYEFRLKFQINGSNIFPLFFKASLFNWWQLSNSLPFFLFKITRPNITDRKTKIYFSHYKLFSKIRNPSNDKLLEKLLQVFQCSSFRKKKFPDRIIALRVLQVREVNTCRSFGWKQLDHLWKQFRVSRRLPRVQSYFVRRLKFPVKPYYEQEVFQFHF